jgi:hypothetical protein
MNENGYAWRASLKLVAQMKPLGSICDVAWTVKSRR